MRAVKRGPKRNRRQGGTEVVAQGLGLLFGRQENGMQNLSGALFGWGQPAAVENGIG
jgi:hypothetical protein